MALGCKGGRGLWFVNLPSRRTCLGIRGKMARVILGEVGWADLLMDAGRGDLT